MCFPSGLMLQDSYIIAPLVWCMIKVVITQKSNDGTWYFVVDPTSVYLACLAGAE